METRQLTAVLLIASLAFASVLAVALTDAVLRVAGFGGSSGAFTHDDDCGWTWKDYAYMAGGSVIAVAAAPVVVGAAGFGAAGIGAGTLAASSMSA